MAYPEPLFVTSTKDDRVGPAMRGRWRPRCRRWACPSSITRTPRAATPASANQHEVAHRVSLEMTYLTRKLMD